MSSASTSSSFPAFAAGPVRNVVLVDGAYADGSSWRTVIEILQRAGLRVTSVQNPLTSLADDVAATQRILALQDGLAILVGHSFAGTVISEAGGHPHVVGLVYVAARAPDAGEDYAALTQRFPTPPANAGLVYNEGFGALTEAAFLNDFANGVGRYNRASRPLSANAGWADEIPETARGHFRVASCRAHVLQCLGAMLSLMPDGGIDRAWC